MFPTLPAWADIILSLACFVYSLYTVLTFVYCFVFIPKEEHGFQALTPARIYREYEVNWFGAITFYILCIVINPIWMIYSWFYLLFTCGRKD